MEICRIQQPKTKEYVTRFISLIFIDFKCHQCCENNGETLWLNQEQITELMKTKPDFDESSISLWGIECLEFLKSLILKPIPTVKFREISIKKTLRNVLKESMHASLMDTIGIEKRELLILLNEFIVHCYPSETMSFAAFYHFCFKMLHFSSLLTAKKISMMFNSFRFNKNLFLTFKDFILGICLMENTSISILQNQTSLLASWLYEQRLPYIFRYYDLNQDGNLNASELLYLVEDYITELNERGYTIPSYLASDQLRLKCVDNLLKQFGHKNASTDQLSLSIDKALIALQKGFLDKSTSGDFDSDIDVPKIVFSLNIDIDRIVFKFNYNRLSRRSVSYSFCKSDDYIRYIYFMFSNYN